MVDSSINFPTQKHFTICSHCVLDTTIPQIRFDEQGICNFCKSHDLMMAFYPRVENVLNKLREELISKIKSSGRNKKYDCIVGISGGTDSTYTLYLAKKLGLKPLAVHLDDGWDSTTAVTNIHNAVRKLNVDLETFVLDWEQIRRLHAAFFKASVPDPGVPTDVAILGALYQTALKEHIKYILGGQSFMTEGTQPLQWSFIEGTYVESINRLFGHVPLKNYPNVTIYHVAYYTFIKGIKHIPFLNYFNYSKKEAQKILSQELEWTYYGGHHYESIFPQFINAYYNLKKFNIDRRKVTLSASVRMGQITRPEALQILRDPPTIEREMIEYCIKKLDFSQSEFAQIMLKKPKNFRDYQTSYGLLKKIRFLIKLAVKMKLITPVLYEKYLS